MNILLIGENCKDVFIYGYCERLNPEAPTPVFVPISENSNYGMAGNVKSNIESLGYRCDFITNENLCHKKRYVDKVSNYILLRVDDDIKYNPIKIDDLPNLNNYDCVIISDYNKGLVSEDLIKYIGENSKLSFIDTKKEIGEWIKPITYIKINNKEYNQNKKFIDNNVLKNTIITMGGDGCKLGDFICPSKQVEVRDVVGAGDTFLSSLSIKYLETMDIKLSMEFANKCAGEVVQKKGVALPTKK